MRRMMIAALLSVAACTEQKSAELPANEVVAPPAQTEAKAEVPSLEGSWQVTMIDGAEAKPLGMTATIGGGQASLS
ncbi:MAG TPA: hypothetical protein VGD23_11805, partial [Sphingomicrobium sp.]